MAGPDYSAHSFIRSRSRGQLQQPTGRAPSIEQGRGGAFVRGFRSKPGAPHSAQDGMNNLTGMNREADGFTSSSDWANFFKGNSPEGVRQGYAPSSQAIADASGVDFSAPQTTPDIAAPTSSPSFFSDPEGFATFTPPETTPQAPSLLSDPMGFAAGAPTKEQYLGSVINNAQSFFRRVNGGLLGG